MIKKLLKQWYKKYRRVKTWIRLRKLNEGYRQLLPGALKHEEG